MRAKKYGYHIIAILSTIAFFIGAHYLYEALSFYDLIGGYNFQIETKYETLPDSAKSCLEDWNIIRSDQRYLENSDEIDAASLETPYITGLTVFGEHTIYLSADNYNANESFYHEVGHVVDYTYSMVSRTEEFKEIFEEEKDLFYIETLNSYALTNEMEYFASIYNLILNDNAPILCPKSVAFVKQYI